MLPKPEANAIPEMGIVVSVSSFLAKRIFCVVSSAFGETPVKIDRRTVHIRL
jgi:hypothetical protein